MIRWPLWFLLVPPGFVVVGWLVELGVPGFDLAAVLCLFCALFARPQSLPGLLLGAAIGRALVDEAAIPVQMLVLGVPIAVLLPLRALFFRQQLWWQVAALLLCTLAIQKLAQLGGQWFAQPSASAVFSAERLFWTIAIGPPLLWLLRRLPPLAAFAERSP